MRSRSAGWAFGAILGVKMETNAGARSGTGKIKGSFILFERAPRRGDYERLRGCCCQCFEHEALLYLLGGAGTGQSGAQHPWLLPKSAVQLAPRVLRSLVLCNGCTSLLCSAVASVLRPLGYDFNSAFAGKPLPLRN